jgi:hypothetical protein
MTPHSPWLRLLAGVVAVALAVRLTYELLQPVIPALLVVAVVVTIARAVAWYRERW